LKCGETPLGQKITPTRAGMMVVQTSATVVTASEFSRKQFKLEMYFSGAKMKQQF
jgi:hypothetical protein